MSAEIPIDPEAIENLRALNPDDGDGFLRDIVTIFLEDTPARIGELRESMAAGDVPKFTRAAHSIKGSASNLGANQLRTIAADLEHRSKIQGLTTLAPTVDQLAGAFAVAKAELDRIVPPV
jgi:histidine phosphotransfer protein HptB